MPRVSGAFFAVGVVCLLCGMLLGIHMGMANNFVLAPAHAHLNLVGWATMALYGSFYALAPHASPRLAWSNFVVSTLGVLVMLPSLAMFLRGGNDPKWEPALDAGSVITALGALIFAISVFRELFRRRA